jgi:AraC-like DNA-binding protein
MGMSRVPVPARSEWTTSSIEEAHALVAAAYTDSHLRVRGSAEGFRYEYSRYDIGPVRFDRITNTLHTDYWSAPIGCAVVTRVLARTIDIEIGRRDSRFGRGDIFLAAHPYAGHHTLLRGSRLELVSIDVPLLQEVAGDAGPPGELLSRLRFGHRLAPGGARYWQHTVNYLTRSLPANPAAEASPLVVGAAGRMVAAALLAAATTERASARPADRTDATPATLGRAFAFIEANPDLDISVADIARAARVTTRAVQLAFRKHLDTTPTAYLRRVRLDHARQELRSAVTGDGTTVSAVAARWGYFNPSRFTAHYRLTYGELPSQTLRD